MGILRRAVAVLEDWIQALSRFLSRVAARVCKSYLLTRCWEYGIGLGCGTGQEFDLGRERFISKRSGEKILT